MFNFTEVEEQKEFTNNRVEPGVDLFTITGFKFEPANNSCILTLSGTKKDSSGSDIDTEMKEFLSMSERAKPWSLRKIKHIATKIVDEEKANLLTTPEQIEALFVGRKLRFKISCRQVMKEKDGKVRTFDNPTIGLPPFCENPSEISDDKSTLVYDPENKYDYQKVETNVSNNLNVNSSQEESNDDLPF